MAKRKKQRTVYVTKEPDWKSFIGITDPELQEKAFNYLVSMATTLCFCMTLIALSKSSIQLSNNSITLRQ